MENKPEVGSNMIFQIKEDGGLKLIGISEHYYEATKKIYNKSRKKHIMIQKQRIKKKIKPQIDLEEFKGLVKEAKKKTTIGEKKYKKRRKRNLKKESTIRLIEKINSDY